MLNNLSHQVHFCRQLLVYFHGIKFVRAHWFPIVLRDSSSFVGVHGLALLMSLDYNDKYLPLLMASSLIVEQSINTKGVGSEKRLVPSISKDYIWYDFFSEYRLTSMELSYACRETKDILC
jgi:hypothetical protein